MKRIILSLIAVFFLIGITLAQTQEQTQTQEKAQIKTRTKEAIKAEVQSASGTTQRGTRFIDKDGDGVCDNKNTTKAQNKVAVQTHEKNKEGKKHGPGDGTGNKGVGPKDGTGYGAKKGTGKK
ncbi:MAG: hypothetical protein N3A63_07055 [Bacteroidetes bacterium]|nr:hypothetical protein [Bacteroidota bacterium]